MQPGFIESGAHVNTRQVWGSTLNSMWHSSDQHPAAIFSLQHQRATTVTLQENMSQICVYMLWDLRMKVFVLTHYGCQKHASIITAAKYMPTKCKIYMSRWFVESSVRCMLKFILLPNCSKLGTQLKPYELKNSVEVQNIFYVPFVTLFSMVVCDPM
jgi:hypothetical protein